MAAKITFNFLSYQLVGIPFYVSRLVLFRRSTACAAPPRSVRGTTRPMAIFDPIFGSEDRRWGFFVFKPEKRRWGVLRRWDVLRNWGGSSKNLRHLRITPPIFEGPPSVFEEPPHLRSSGFEDRRSPIFDLRSRRSKNLTIVNIRSSASKIEESRLSSIFGLEEWIEDRTEDEGCATSSKKQVFLRIGGLFDLSGFIFRPIFRLEHRSEDRDQPSTRPRCVRFCSTSQYFRTLHEKDLQRQKVAGPLDSRPERRAHFVPLINRGPNAGPMRVFFPPSVNIVLVRAPERAFRTGVFDALAGTRTAVSPARCLGGNKDSRQPSDIVLLTLREEHLRDRVHDLVPDDPVLHDSEFAPFDRSLVVARLRLGSQLYNTFRIRNPDITRARRNRAARGGATMRGGARLDETPTNRFAQETVVPRIPTRGQSNYFERIIGLEYRSEDASVAKPGESFVERVCLRKKNEVFERQRWKIASFFEPRR